MDFEKTAINAVEDTLGRDIIQGCFYHLTQSTHRKIQELGLESSYWNDPTLCLFSAISDGLAFLPIHDVKRGIEYFKTIVSDENKELLIYFDKNYVNGELRYGRNSQRQVELFFPPETWNVFNVTIAGENRKNNVCEGWNNRFQHIIGHKKPKIGELIEKMRMETSTWSKSVNGLPLVFSNKSCDVLTIMRTQELYGAPSPSTCYKLVPLSSTM
ncbi:unnamed protein product [Gordionus sp. m RMFG-2023]